MTWEIPSSKHHIRRVQSFSHGKTGNFPVMMKPYADSKPMLNMFKLEYHGHEILWADLHSSTRSSSLLSTSSTDGQLHPASQGDSIEPDNIPTISHRSRVNPAINMLITEKNHPKARKPGIKHPASVDLNANIQSHDVLFSDNHMAGWNHPIWLRQNHYHLDMFLFLNGHAALPGDVPSSVISRWQHLWAKYGTPGRALIFTGPNCLNPHQSSI